MKKLVANIKEFMKFKSFHASKLPLSTLIDILTRKCSQSPIYMSLSLTTTKTLKSFLFPKRFRNAIGKCLFPFIYYHDGGDPKNLSMLYR